MTDTAVPPNLIAAVRAYAIENYETDGWDFVVECFEDADIATAIGSAGTRDAAIAAVRKTARLLDEQRSGVRAEIF